MCASLSHSPFGLIRLRNWNHSDIKTLTDYRYKQPYELPSLPPPNEPSSTPIEDSWIYTFCIKCRGKDTTPSWEPPMWQKFCPFPLCPTFRQFARLWCIIIIGKRCIRETKHSAQSMTFSFYEFVESLQVLSLGSYCSVSSGIRPTQEDLYSIWLP